jgi:molybdopterin biosynthesis enzyme
LKRKETDRLEWFPVLTGYDETVRLVEYHGSGHISALCRAEGLVAVDIGVAEIPKGAVVEMRLL